MKSFAALHRSSPDLHQIFPKSLQEILEKPVVSALGNAWNQRKDKNYEWLAVKYTSVLGDACYRDARLSLSPGLVYKMDHTENLQLHFSSQVESNTTAASKNPCVSLLSLSEPVWAYLSLSEPFASLSTGWGSPSPGVQCKMQVAASESVGMHYENLRTMRLKWHNESPGTSRLLFWWNCQCWHALAHAHIRPMLHVQYFEPRCRHHVIRLDSFW